jgi:hypothetical protein
MQRHQGIGQEAEYRNSKWFRLPGLDGKQQKTKVEKASGIRDNVPGALCVIPRSLDLGPQCHGGH